MYPIELKAEQVLWNIARRLKVTEASFKGDECI